MMPSNTGGLRNLSFQDDLNKENGSVHGKPPRANRGTWHLPLTPDPVIIVSTVKYTESPNLFHFHCIVP